MICITESKQHAIKTGFIQNIVQCESMLQTNKKKRKADMAFEIDYLYGIVTTHNSNRLVFCIVQTRWNFLYSKKLKYKIIDINLIWLYF